MTANPFKTRVKHHFGLFASQNMGKKSGCICKKKKKNLNCMLGLIKDGGTFSNCELESKLHDQYGSKLNVTKQHLSSKIIVLKKKMENED